MPGTSDARSADADLQRLAARLKECGLQAEVESGLLYVANPLHGRLTEEVRISGDRYLTSFGAAIGYVGREAECADRIARILAISSAPAGGDSA